VPPRSPSSGAIPSISARLATPRIVLRAARTTDVPELRRIHRKNADHLRPWSPAHAKGEDPTSLTAISNMVARYRQQWKRGEAFVLLVTLRTGGEPIIGRVSLGGILRGVFQNAHLGYWIDADHQRRGLMTEAVDVALAFAFGMADLHRVQAAVMPNNPGSLRLLEKVGFRREGFAERYLEIAGTWQDHAIFAMTREEWKPRTDVTV
jgi:ribosomal-protein-alanine N-acetyltransferase